MDARVRREAHQSRPSICKTKKTLMEHTRVNHCLVRVGTRWQAASIDFDWKISFITIFHNVFYLNTRRKKENQLLTF